MDTPVGGSLERQATSKKICLACDRQYTGQANACPHDGTVLVPLKEDSLIGHTIADRYLIQSVLGQGGMGLVYLAKHTMMDRVVAIKMLHQELSNDENSTKRFQQEAKAASCLNHPHIITLYDFGIMPTGQAFLCMEYLHGVPLLDVMKREGIIEPRRAVKIFSQVCEGLHHAHNQGIVHRDLKPSNIILIEHENDREFVKVVDFGLAKLMPWSGKESQHLTRTGEVFGSPIYMSPEQCMGKQLRETSDIYSLGVTLYEALTGKPPFRGKNSIATAQKHVQEHPPTFSEARADLELPPNLEAVVFKALEKEPSKRFQSMAEMKEALEKALLADYQIETPESLVSSRSGIKTIVPPKPAKPAVSVSDFGTKTVVSKPVKSSSETPSPAKSFPKGIAAAIGVLAIAGAAGGAFILMQPPPGVQADGIVYFFRQTPTSTELHLKVTDETGQSEVRQMVGGPDAKIKMRDDAAQTNGNLVSVVYEPGKSGAPDKLKELSVKEREVDGNASEASLFIRSIIQNYAIDDPLQGKFSESAWKEWEQISKEFPTTGLLEYWYPPEKKDPGEEILRKTARQVQEPSHVVAIDSVSDTQAKAVVGLDSIFSSAKGSLVFDLQKQPNSEWIVTSVTQQN